MATEVSIENPTVGQSNKEPSEAEVNLFPEDPRKTAVSVDLEQPEDPKSRVSVELEQPENPKSN